METKKTPIQTKSSEIWIDDDNILCVKFREEYSEWDLKEVKECFKVYQDLGFGNGHKALQLIDGRLSFNITKEGKDFAAANGKTFFIASAIVADNLATRIVVNFFNKFYKHDVPFKMFSTKRKAKEWLLKFRE